MQNNYNDYKSFLAKCKAFNKNAKEELNSLVTAWENTSLVNSPPGSGSSDAPTGSSAGSGSSNASTGSSAGSGSSNAPLDSASNAPAGSGSSNASAGSGSANASAGSGSSNASAGSGSSNASGSSIPPANSRPNSGFDLSLHCA